ncbi:Fruiting body protein SC1 [Hypsizygus marmoreus]|uniref:Hydrophobin n=1 Tax=Hypsizygus marmoreus TaxID=39966 RepID=A0A369JK37_HYPMA|nr:Fruiting body protein SC1 [Hypsizygus marmoreus]
MFARVSTLLCLALYATASAIPRRSEYESQCNTGSVQCCNSVQNADSQHVGLLAALLGLDLSAITGQVGVTCSPLTAIGLGGNSCTQQPVCCSGNSFKGLIVVGCTPINIGL